MANNPVFMRRAAVATPAAVRVNEVPRVSTTARPSAAATAQPVALKNPALARELTKLQIRPIPTDRGTVTRDQVKVPIAPAQPADTHLYADHADAAKKYYLPRYRMRQQDGRYEIAVTAAQDGGWQLKAGLERYPAPELRGTERGASELAHDIAVFFRYHAGPANSIEKQVDFTERIDDPKGVTVSARLTLEQRDGLLLALQTNAANPKLVVRRAIHVAVKVEDPNKPKENPAILRTRNSQTIPRPTIPVAAQPGLQRRALALEVQDARFAQPATPQPVDRYRIVQSALDDVADPDPFVLDPRLHPYLYEGVAISSSGARGFKRIVLAHPVGAPNARFHAYLQDKSEPWVFYYLPDRFKLSRRDVAPYLPQMVVRISAPDGALDTATVTTDFMVEPYVDEARLTAAKPALKREIPAATSQQSEPELRPLQSSKSTLQLWLPSSAGATLQTFNEVSIDLANGFLHSVTLPLEGFRQLYGAAYSRDVTTLFTGDVLIETGLANAEKVPLSIRFADTQGEILSFTEQPSDKDGIITVQMENAIESPVKITALPVRVKRGEQEAVGKIEGISFEQPLELAPGARVSFAVKSDFTSGTQNRVIGGILDALINRDPNRLGQTVANEAAQGVGPLDAIFDTAHVAVLPDAEKILPLISDTSVPAQYERQIEVMTLAELLGEPSDSNSIVLINVELKGGTSVKLTRDVQNALAEVRLPLMPLLLGSDTQGKYSYRQQIIRRNGTRTQDANWRETDNSLLVLPEA